MPAGLKRFGSLAQQAGHQALGQCPLADTGRTVQQIGMSMLSTTGHLLPE